tara:strand:+ start:3242 stop:4435 length:1194 start_codon:yes stop_codon:yes gene_type:complete
MNIASIILKKLTGNLSREEEIIFTEWLGDSDENKMLFSRLEAMKAQGHSLPDLSALNSEVAWEKITTKFEAIKQKRRSSTGFRLMVLKYAAFFIGIGGMTFGLWVYSTSDTNLPEIDPQAITLKMANGEVRIISPGATQVITDVKGNVLGTKEDGRLDYSNTNIDEDLVYNTLSVPNGKKFKLILSDGSEVHLNAGSSLRYPVKFLTGMERHVFLSGEAYFDVDKDTEHPFIVTSGKMDIRVLGTEFNVTAYPEDVEIKTVLVEGSVSLYASTIPYQKSTSTLLQPGQKGAWRTADENLDIEAVDTSIYTGWRDGKLVLKKMRFEDIVKRLQRHYDVQISNGYKELDQRVFTATFDIETIVEVLNTFAEETHFEYDILDRKISIRRPSEPNPKSIGL